MLAIAMFNTFESPTDRQSTAAGLRGKPGCRRLILSVVIGLYSKLVMGWRRVIWNFQPLHKRPRKGGRTPFIAHKDVGMQLFELAEFLVGQDQTYNEQQESQSTRAENDIHIICAPSVRTT